MIKNTLSLLQIVFATECSKTIDLLKRGPPNIPLIINSGSKYTDSDFEIQGES